MGLKSLFFNDTEETTENKEVKSETKFPSAPQTQSFPTSFPTATTTVAAPSFPTGNNQFVDKFVEAYQACFDNANQSGYDFYEFYQAIMNSGGIDNPQMYVMAMTMGTAMDKTNTKSKLASQADFYLGEISKMYNQNVTSGTSKRQELLTQKESENHNLTTELSNLRAQLEAIQNQINSRESQLSMIDNKYSPLINEVEQKLQANEAAKNTITSNILKVKEGINNNVK